MNTPRNEKDRLSQLLRTKRLVAQQAVSLPGQKRFTFVVGLVFVACTLQACVSQERPQWSRWSDALRFQDAGRYQEAASVWEQLATEGNSEAVVELIRLYDPINNILPNSEKYMQKLMWTATWMKTPYYQNQVATAFLVGQDKVRDRSGKEVIRYPVTRNIERACYWFEKPLSHGYRDDKEAVSKILQNCPDMVAKYDLDQQRRNPGMDRDANAGNQDGADRSNQGIPRAKISKSNETKEEFERLKRKWGGGPESRAWQEQQAREEAEADRQYRETITSQALGPSLIERCLKLTKGAAGLESFRKRETLHFGNCHPHDVFLEPITDSEYAELQRLLPDPYRNLMSVFPYAIAYNLPEGTSDTWAPSRVNPLLGISSLSEAVVDPDAGGFNIVLFRPRRNPREPFPVLTLLKACPLSGNADYEDDSRWSKGGKERWEACIRSAIALLPGRSTTPPQLSPIQQDMVARRLADLRASICKDPVQLQQNSQCAHLRPTTPATRPYVCDPSKEYCGRATK